LTHSLAITGFEIIREEHVGVVGDAAVFWILRGEACPRHFLLRSHRPKFGELFFRPAINPCRWIFPPEALEGRDGLLTAAQLNKIVDMA
jgi:hypothetical protein